MVLCFCKDRTYVESLPYIDINGTDIERVTQAKVLGVTISSDLSWTAHVDEIVSKAGKRVYMIYHLKRAGINQIDLVRIYVSACILQIVNIPTVHDRRNAICKAYFGRMRRCDHKLLIMLNRTN